MDGLYSNGSVIRPAWLFNDGSRCESLKHFYIKFYDIYDGLVRLKGGCGLLNQRGNAVKRRSTAWREVQVCWRKNFQKINVQLQ